LATFANHFDGEEEEDKNEWLNGKLAGFKNSNEIKVEI
jgi:hypothetical protein